jgi:hypothetical protein
MLNLLIFLCFKNPTYKTLKLSQIFKKNYRVKHGQGIIKISENLLELMHKYNSDYAQIYQRHSLF